jgi:hypothetical protein
MSEHTVLILGAGASLAYGLPLGKGLVEKIHNLLPSNETDPFTDAVENLLRAIECSAECLASWKSVSNKSIEFALIEFKQRLKYSDPKSIDAFLSRDFGSANLVFRLIGKLCIAHVIATCESKDNIDGAESNHAIDHWYRYLWQDCLNSTCQSLEEVKAKKLRIVSFNYDRSLEYFLGMKLAPYLNKPGVRLDPKRISSWAQSSFQEIENSFEITHPYGTLGSLSEVPYGETTNSKAYVSKMALNIRVIGEERVGDDSFSKAKDWVAGAKNVIFLGFSFDATNMERLGLAAGLAPSIKSIEGQIMREVHPLTYGLERAERSALVKKFFSEFASASGYFASPHSDNLTISESHNSIPITQYLRRYGGLMTI